MRRQIIGRGQFRQTVQQRQLFGPLRISGAQFRRQGTDDDAARHCAQGRIGPQHAMIAEQAHHIFRKAQLGKAAFAGSKFVPVIETHTRRAFPRAVMKMHFRPLTQRPGRGTKARQADQPATGREQGSRAADNVTPVNIVHFHALHVHGAAPSGTHHFGGITVALQAPGPAERALRLNADFLARLHRSGSHRAGHNRTVPLERKDPIHRQTENIRTVPRGHFLHAVENILFQRVQPLAGGRRHRKNGRAFQKAARHELTHVFRNQRQPVGIDHINLGQGHKAAPDAEQRADFQMLARLRHDAFIRCNDQHHEVHAGRARHHVLDEALMPGHVHDAEPLAVRHDGPGKAQLDGDAAPLLFLKPIAVDTRQRPYQRCLAVINVPGRTHDY